MIFLPHSVSKKQPNGPAIAAKWLEWMEHRHSQGDTAARPDVIKYTTCITASAMMGDAERADELLSQMQAAYLNGNDKAQPDVSLHEFVLKAWMGIFGNGSKANGRRAMDLLSTMWKCHGSGAFDNLRPTDRTYKILIDGFKKMRQPSRATNLLLELERFYDEKKVEKGASRAMYQGVIEAWKASRESDRKIQVNQLKIKMNQRFPLSKNRFHR